MSIFLLKTLYLPNQGCYRSLYSYLSKIAILSLYLPLHRFIIKFFFIYVPRVDINCSWKFGLHCLPPDTCGILGLDHQQATTDSNLQKNNNNFISCIYLFIYLFIYIYIYLYIYVCMQAFVYVCIDSSACRLNHTPSIIRVTMV